MPESRKTSVLIVDVEPLRLARIERAANNAGLAVSTASSFEAARRQILQRCPEVVVAALRLGEYNGFHLAAVTPHDFQKSAAFVYSEHDEPGAAADAQCLGARFVTDEQVCHSDFWQAVAGASALADGIGVTAEGR